MKHNTTTVLIEREQYNLITIDVFPVRETYEIGSQGMLNCTLNPTSSRDGDMISYKWITAQLGILSPISTLAYSIVPYYLNSVDYYCHVYRNGRLLEIQRATLNIEGIIIILIITVHPVTIHHHYQAYSREKIFMARAVQVSK